MGLLDHLAINESGFTFDPHTGESYRLNETAVSLVKILKQTADEEQAAHKLTELFEVGFAEAYEDILEFMASLKNFGIISPSNMD